MNSLTDMIKLDVPQACVACTTLQPPAYCRVCCFGPRGRDSSVDTESRRLKSQPKLQAPVYDILPSTTAVFSYAMGSRKLSANEQFFSLVLKQ